MRLLVLADTHVPKRARDLPPEVWAAVAEADVVVHAGDWVGVDLLERLQGCDASADRRLGQQRRSRPPRAASRNRTRRAGGGTRHRRPRDGRSQAPRGARRPPLPRHGSADLRPLPHSLGLHEPQRDAAAEPRLPHRPAPPAAPHLPHRRARRSPCPRRSGCTRCTTGEDYRRIRTRVQVQSPQAGQCSQVG